MNDTRSRQYDSVANIPAAAATSRAFSAASKSANQRFAVSSAVVVAGSAVWVMVVSSLADVQHTATRP